MMQELHSLEHWAVRKLGFTNWINKVGQRDDFQRNQSLGDQIHETLDRLCATAIGIPYQGGTSLKTYPLWFPKCLQGGEEKSRVTHIHIRKIDIKAERKKATAKKTVFNKSVALFRPLLKMVEKEIIKGYGRPKVRVIHSHGVETPRNKEQVAKRQGPTPTKMMEYLAQELICHVRDSNSHVFGFKKVTKLKPQKR